MRLCLLLVLLFGCTKGDDTGDTDTDTDTDVDTDTDSDTDTGGAAERVEIYALCAAGGPVSDGSVSGVMCMSPLDVASAPATDGDHYWTPGPIGRMYR